MKERINVGEIVCYETEKSGRWSVDTVSNYKKACGEHLNNEEKTREITLNEHKITKRERDGCRGNGIVEYNGITVD